MRRFLIPVSVIASLGGCAASTGQACAPGLGTPSAIFTLFLGEAIKGRDDLTDKEWLSFVETTITGNLPNGYTVFDAHGGWMNPFTHKTVKESTKVLLVALPEGPAGLGAINRIRTAYQDRFHQQLVGMTVEHGCAAF